MSDSVPVLPPKNTSGRRTGLIAAIVVAVLVIAGVVAYVATRGSSDDAAAGDGSTAPTVVRLGTTDVSQPHWEILKELAA